MKKIIAILLCIVFIFSFSACGNNQSTLDGSSLQQGSIVSETSESYDVSSQKSVENQSSDLEKTKNNSSKALESKVDTSSVSDISAVSSSAVSSSEPEREEFKTLVVYFSWSESGNTEKMADTIKNLTGGDIFELIPLNAYPTDYTECTEAALEERDNNARPEIADLPETLDDYDRIFVGYPIWWHTAPMIIGTFLESYDLTGVEIYPFSQSASMDAEQFDTSMEFVRSCAGNADVHDGLFAEASDTDAIAAYLNENGF